MSPRTGASSWREPDRPSAWMRRRNGGRPPDVGTGGTRDSLRRLATRRRRRARCRTSHRHQPRPPAGRQRLRQRKEPSHDDHPVVHLRPHLTRQPTLTSRSGRREATTSRPSKPSARPSGPRSRRPTCCSRSTGSGTPRDTGPTSCTSRRTARSHWWPLYGCPGRRRPFTTTCPGAAWASTRALSTRRSSAPPLPDASSPPVRPSPTPATSPACYRRATSIASTTRPTRRRSRCTCTAPT